MNLIFLKEKEQFKKLKKGDFILVKWSDDYVKHHQLKNNLGGFTIDKIQGIRNEVICCIKRNLYFNYSIYLKGKSVAKEIYFVEE
ncbi:MAG: hypothetical protein ACOCP8_07100 [archaeon]